MLLEVGRGTAPDFGHCYSTECGFLWSICPQIPLNPFVLLLWNYSVYDGLWNVFKALQDAGLHMVPFVWGCEKRPNLRTCDVSIKTFSVPQLWPSFWVFSPFSMILFKFYHFGTSKKLFFPLILFYFFKKKINYVFTFCISFSVPTFVPPSIPSTYTPTQPLTHASEMVRHIVLWSIQGLPYYI